MHTLPEKQSGTKYGLFGYEGAMADAAVRTDNAENLIECIRRGYIDKDTKTVFDHSMIEHCRLFGAVECEKALIKLGW